MKERITSLDNYVREKGMTSLDGKGDGTDTKTDKKDDTTTPTVNPDTEKIKTFEIGGKTYKGVLSTFSAVADKQKSMGTKEIGVLSLPGEDSVYEMFKEESKKEE
jgi:hypothetical protein